LLLPFKTSVWSLWMKAKLLPTLSNMVHWQVHRFMTLPGHVSN
jgi:hypothetical protein